MTLREVTVVNDISKFSKNKTIINIATNVLERGSLCCKLTAVMVITELRFSVQCAY